MKVSPYFLRILKLQGGLEIPTFRMSIMKEGDGPHKASMIRDDEEMFPSIVLSTAANIDTSKLMQWGSIIVEGVMLAMSAIGISLSPGNILFSTHVHKKLWISIINFINWGFVILQSCGLFLTSMFSEDGTSKLFG